MVDVHFDRPVMDPRKRPEENIAVLERWAAELINNLNLLVTQTNKEIDDGK